MSEIEQLAQLPVERLQELARATAVAFVPQTETAPGMTEEGTIPEASANVMPSPDPLSSNPEEEPITAAQDISARRRKAVLSKIENLRNMQANQEGLV